MNDELKDLEKRLADIPVLPMSPDQAKRLTDAVFPLDPKQEVVGNLLWFRLSMARAAAWVLLLTFTGSLVWYTWQDSMNMGMPTHRLAKEGIPPEGNRAGSLYSYKIVTMGPSEEAIDGEVAIPLLADHQVALSLSPRQHLIMPPTQPD